mmetsp:Transcript_3637/g.6192  ORF Transcript_3637/g.6192 Transcript_3637/m.6192 type:complete len:205 (-) Transcript_3637:1031-1645(-)
MRGEVDLPDRQQVLPYPAGGLQLWRRPHLSLGGKRGRAHSREVDGEHPAPDCQAVPGAEGAGDVRLRLLPQRQQLRAGADRADAPHQRPQRAAPGARVAELPGDRAAGEAADPGPAAAALDQHRLLGQLLHPDHQGLQAGRPIHPPPPNRPAAHQGLPPPAQRHPQVRRPTHPQRAEPGDLPAVREPVRQQQPRLPLPTLRLRR